MSEVSKPKSPAVPKFHSPKQLMTSWLRTNSRKRAHSDSDDKTDHKIKSVKSDPSSELNITVGNILQNGEQPLLAQQNNQTQEHGTNSTKENYFSQQKSPTVSPLKKRLCIDNPLTSTAHCQESEHAKPTLNPGKENLTPYCSSEEAEQAKEKGVTKSKETLDTTSNQHITPTKSFNPTRTQNWLTEWSVYCKAKYGVASIASEILVETNNVTDENSSASDLQPSSAQVGCYFSWNI